MTEYILSYLEQNNIKKLKKEKASPFFLAAIFFTIISIFSGFNVGSVITGLIGAICIDAIFAVPIIHYLLPKKMSAFAAVLKTKTAQATGRSVRYYFALDHYSRFVESIDQKHFNNAREGDIILIVRFGVKQSETVFLLSELQKMENCDYCDYKE